MFGKEIYYSFYQLPHRFVTHRMHEPESNFHRIIGMNKFANMNHSFSIFNGYQIFFCQLSNVIEMFL